MISNIDDGFKGGVESGNSASKEDARETFLQGEITKGCDMVIK